MVERAWSLLAIVAMVACSPKPNDDVAKAENAAKAQNAAKRETKQAVPPGTSLEASGAAEADAGAPTDTKVDPEALAAGDPCAAAKREGGPLRWFHDDYAGALACARSKHLPLMIDMWAPWCHTCLSMQAYVLVDEKLADYDRRYVFLALDTDRESNAEVVAKFPPAAWPTFFAISSVDESIQARFVGAATVEQMAQFLDDGERGSKRDDAALAKHELAARDGDRAASRKDWPAAAKAYGDAIASAPPEWTRLPDVHVSNMAALVRGESWDECMTLAHMAMSHTGNSASAADFCGQTLSCADGQKDPKHAKALREQVVQRLTALVDDTAAPLSADDRSDAMLILRNALDALARKDDARTIAERQRKLLDEAAAATTEPRVAMTYNWPRAEVYAYLGIHRELVPALMQSAAALPKEYDPPYRLAWLMWKAGDLPVAIEWADKAIALAYGPRKARAQAMLADIHAQAGDVEAERAARTAVLATLQGLPAAAQQPEAIAKAKADLEAVGKPAAPAGAAKH
jgi:thiol-disulfide isomerase/thioredoxin